MLLPLGSLPGFCALEAVASSLSSQRQQAVLGYLMINEEGFKGCERSRANLEGPEAFVDPKGPGLHGTCTPGS